MRTYFAFVARLQAMAVKSLILGEQQVHQHIVGTDSEMSQYNFHELSNRYDMIYFCCVKNLGSNPNIMHLTRSVGGAFSDREGGELDYDIGIKFFEV